MLTRLNKLHPALKHAGYSATTLLPGEDPAAFEKLHRALIHEFAPVGTRPMKHFAKKLNTNIGLSSQRTAS
jgi:hypothetical protein